VISVASSSSSGVKTVLREGAADGGSVGSMVGAPGVGVVAAGDEVAPGPAVHPAKRSATSATALIAQSLLQQFAPNLAVGRASSPR
jgi:hypothetical protein